MRISLQLPNDHNEIYQLLLYALLYVIGIPLTISSLVILRNNWNSYYFLKRKRGIILTILLSLATYLLVSVFVRTQTFFNINVFIYALFSTLITFPCVYMVFGLLILRLWLFYFKFELISIENNRKWRLAVDPIKELKVDQINWYFNYQKKFGNGRYLYRRTVMISMFQSIVTNVLSFLSSKDNIEALEDRGVSIKVEKFDVQLFETITIGFIATCFAFYGIMCVYFIFKLKYRIKYDDTFGIKHELIYESLLLISFLLSGIGLFVSPLSSYAGPLFSFVTVSIYMVFMYLVVIYPKIFYINKQLSGKKRYSKKSKHYKYTQAGIPIANINGKKKTKNKNQNEKDKVLDMPLLQVQYSFSDYNWNDIVSIYDGYEAFMTHLESEFSFENLLYVQEVSQSTLFLTFITLCVLGTRLMFVRQANRLLRAVK